MLMSMLGGGATTISTLKSVCVLMSMLGGGTAVISILNCVCVLMSMLIPTLKRVCSCQCLEVAQPQSPCILEPRVCVLIMSMLGGGATTIPTLKRVCAFAHVNAWWWWDYKRKARSFLKGNSIINSSILIQMSSEST